MSNSGSGEGSNEETAMSMFECRRCPGKLFTPEAVEGHRQFHRREKEKRRAAQEAASGLSRAMSEASSGTLFTRRPIQRKEKETKQSQGKKKQPIRDSRNKRVGDPGQGLRRAENKTPKKKPPAERPKSRGKITSKKNYNDDVSSSTSSGG